jgi:hypothetical protein
MDHLKQSISTRSVPSGEEKRCAKIEDFLGKGEGACSASFKVASDGASFVE